MGLIENPRFYDFVQKMVGADIIKRKLAPWLSDLANRSVVDVGAGTGGYSSLVSSSATYVGLDYDPLKLGMLRAKFPGRLVVQGDATSLPLATKSFDCVVATALSHHLNDWGFTAMIDEFARVLKGRLIFLDAIWNPRSLRGRALWSIDRGAHPRTADELLSGIGKRFKIDHVDRYSVHHHYIFIVATPLT